MIRHILDRLTPQVDEVIIIANRHQQEYAALGVPVFSDYIQGFHGPLVGMATGLQHAGYDRVVFVPCDGPFISTELVKSFTGTIRAF
ncbi:MAG: NTP transferase domain-containing protein [Nitrincola sp.]|nr:NTP transferase domain-containing protein [Nitrincola sp.]